MFVLREKEHEVGTWVRRWEALEELEERKEYDQNIVCGKKKLRGGGKREGAGTKDSRGGATLA